MNNIFMCMNPAKIVDLINRARSRIVFINSGINEEIASALIIKSESIGKTNITIFTDFSEAVCQYGYGTALGFDHINDGGLDVNKIENLRIGCLLVDNDGWVFTPTPLLLEADKIIDTQPNAIKVTPDQILALLNTTAPELIKPKEKEIIKNKAIAEPEKLKGEKVTKEDIKTLTTKLEKNPPKKFDVSRKVNVFNTLIEFVELNLEGCSIGRKTVSIPSKLIIGGMDSKTQKQLKAGYKVVGSECDLTGKELNKKVEQIRKSYTRSIHHYGRVALKRKRKDLEKAIAEIKDDIAAFQNNLTKNLQKEIDSQKIKLIDALSPSILENPPTELTGQIEDDKASIEEVKLWLDIELTKIFPMSVDLINEMKIESVFKGVTYEILSNDDFQNKVREHYPMIGWNKLFNEFEAIRAKDS